MQLGRAHLGGRTCGQTKRGLVAARPAGPLLSHGRAPCAPVGVSAPAVGGAELGQRPVVEAERDVPGMSAFLDSLKWDKNSLVAVIVQVGRRAPQLSRPRRKGCSRLAEVASAASPEFFAV